MKPDLKCPIRINLDPSKGPIDTKEEVSEKWEAIKQWYKDHPEVNTPWEEWEKGCKMIWDVPDPKYLSSKLIFSQKVIDAIVKGEDGYEPGD